MDLSTGSIPRNLLVFSLPGFHLQAPLVHIMHVASGLHIAQNVVLQLRNGLEEVGHVLVLLDISNNFGGLEALVEIDQIGRCVGRDTVFDERKVRQIDTCETSVSNSHEK